MPVPEGHENGHVRSASGHVAEVGAVPPVVIQPAARCVGGLDQPPGGGVLVGADGTDLQVGHGE